MAARGGSAKVHQHGGAIGAKQHVLGLHIAMDQASLVGNVECTGQFARDFQRVIHCKASADLGLEIASGEILADEKVPMLVLTRAIDANDVGMTQLADDAGFLRKLVEQGGGIGQRAIDHFDCDLPAHLVQRKIDRGHSALADALANLEPWYDWVAHSTYP